MGSLTYGRSFSYYENGEIGIYRLNQGSPVLNNQLKQTDAQGIEESNMGGLANLAYNFSNDHQLGGNIFFSRSGISTSRYMYGHWPQELDNERIVYNRVLGWKERDLMSYQLRGEHHFESMFNSTIEWTASFATTTQNEPDLRLIFDIEDTSRTPSAYTIRGSNFDDPARYYRDLEDNSGNYNLNFTVPFSQWNGLLSKVKFGGLYQESDRVFSERIFSYLPDNTAFNEADGDLTTLFSDEYNGVVEIDTLAGGALMRYNFGNVIRDNSRARNNYTGDQQVAAGYAMLDMPLSRDLRFIGGLRYETTEINVISRDTTLDAGNISEQDFLPSLNFVYRLNDQMNLRLAATQTLARPTFRELAPFSSKEFVNGVDLQGNPDLKRTLIENYDLRWEWFTRPGEILATSVFYKKLKNPIERAFAVGTTESNRIITFTNVDEATILGAEFEARIRLDVFTDLLQDFSFGGNLSLVHSSIDIPASELNSRLSIDSTSATTRELQGQSPYIINLDLTYSNAEWGTTASIHYNSFGERLSKVSANLTPDVYEQPMTVLDLIISQKILDYFTLKFGVKNILDSSYKEVYKYNGQEYIYQSYTRGRRVSLGLSYSI
jgi:TonB-dependent receptor